MIRVEWLNEKNCIYGIMEKLSSDFFDKNVDRRQLSKKIAEYGHFCVAYDDDCAVGFAGYYANDSLGKIGYLSTIVVSKKHQGKGIGSVLLRECLNDCRKKGMEKCRLEVNINNQRAIPFYEAKGFKKESKATQTSDYYICEL